MGEKDVPFRLRAWGVVSVFALLLLPGFFGASSARAAKPRDAADPKELTQQIPTKYRETMKIDEQRMLSEAVTLPFDGYVRGTPAAKPFNLDLPAGTRVIVQFGGYGNAIHAGKTSLRHLEFSPCVPVVFPDGVVNSGSPDAFHQDVFASVRPDSKRPGLVCSMDLQFTENGENRNAAIWNFLDHLSADPDDRSVNKSRRDSKASIDPAPSAAPSGAQPAAQGAD